MQGFIEVGGRRWPAPVWLVRRLMRRMHEQHGSELQYDAETQTVVMERSR